MGASREAVIVGVAECPLGVTDRGIVELNTLGVLAALDDAGLTLADVDGLATNAVGRFSTTALADQLGVRPTWVDSSFVGGSSFVAYVARAAQAIEAGWCEVAVVTYGSNQRSARSRKIGGAIDGHLPQAWFESPYAPLYPISAYAMLARRWMHEFGQNRTAMADVAVAAREWALRNPAAYRHGAGPLTRDDVLGARPLSTPITAADCCLVTDGGGAVVLTSRARAADLDVEPVQLLGFGEATTHDAMASMDSPIRNGTLVAAQQAYGAAGLTAADVDVFELYDSFTITALLTLPAVGLCAPGEEADLVADGGIAPGGLNVNTTGGGLSYCHPGQLGILLVVEAVRQLRGVADSRTVADGGRQVDGAEVALCHGTGGIFSHHATLILGADR